MAKKEKIDFSDIPELTAEDFKRFRRVTPQEHKKYVEALDAQFGKDRPRLKPGPKPHPEKRYVATFIKLPPRVVAWARREGKRRHMGYQTVINQTLLSHVA